MRTRYCAARGVRVLGTGIRISASRYLKLNGKPFEYVDSLPATVISPIYPPDCMLCGSKATAFADVLAAQRTGQKRFHFPTEIIGDALWESACPPCYDQWLKSYGAPETYSGEKDAGVVATPAPVVAASD